MAKEKGEFAVGFPYLGNGEDLLCFNSIDVSWEKPNATDPATVELTCSCAEHGYAMSFTTPIDRTSDTHTFDLNHSPTINQMGCTVTAVIKSGSDEKNRRQRVDMPVRCPLMPIGVTKKKATAAKSRSSKVKAAKATPPKPPIEIDTPDDRIIHLVRGRDKILTGTFDPKFKDAIYIFVIKKVNNDVMIDELVKEVFVIPFTNHWVVSLPQVLWATNVNLIVQLAFLDAHGVITYRHGTPSRIT